MEKVITSISIADLFIFIYLALWTYRTTKKLIRNFFIFIALCALKNSVNYSSINPPKDASFIISRPCTVKRIIQKLMFFKYLFLFDKIGT
jgi:putative flippase GtrA